MFILKSYGGRQHLKSNCSSDDVKKNICKTTFSNPVVVLDEGKLGGQGRGGKWTAENVVRFSITS